MQLRISIKVYSLSDKQIQHRQPYLIESLEPKMQPCFRALWSAIGQHSNPTHQKKISSNGIGKTKIRSLKILSSKTYRLRIFELRITTIPLHSLSPILKAIGIYYKSRIMTPVSTALTTKVESGSPYQLNHEQVYTQSLPSVLFKFILHIRIHTHTLHRY